MPRRIKIQTVEMGTLDLLVVLQAKGVWESDWEALRASPFANLIPIVTREALDHAIRGWSKPLVRSIGLPPEGALKKLPSKLCAVRAICPFHDQKHCASDAKKMPTCFEPSGVEEGVARTLAAEVCRLWHERTYVIVVAES